MNYGYAKCLYMVNMACAQIRNSFHSGWIGDGLIDPTRAVLYAKGVTHAAPPPTRRQQANRSRSRAKPGPKPRIDEETWFETALALLAEGGINAVRVEILAERLRVTKGMFYTRFATRDAFLDALLDYWRRRSTLSRIAEFAAIDEPPIDRLLRIFGISETERARTAAWIETALRVWARSDQRPAKVLAEIDQHRLIWFETVLVANGVPKEEAAARSFLLYSYLICDTMLPGERGNVRAICREYLANCTTSGTRSPRGPGD
jgi:AcrR family transcriptional regulator